MWVGLSLRPSTFSVKEVKHQEGEKTSCRRRESSQKTHLIKDGCLDSAESSRFQDGCLNYTESSQFQDGCLNCTKSSRFQDGCLNYTESSDGKRTTLLSRPKSLDSQFSKEDGQRADKPTERLGTSCVFREMQTGTRRPHGTPVRIRTRTTPQAGEWGATGTHTRCSQGGRLLQPLRKQAWQILTKRN